jgi:putative ABC transport system permease protein
LRELPGVQSASASAVTPISGTLLHWDVEVDVGLRSFRKVHGYFNVVSPGFFRTMGTPLLAGREFVPSDSINSPHVAIVNETAARQFFPGKNPIGQTYRDPAFGKRPEIVQQIVGVVKDTKYLSLKEKPRSVAYVPMAQNSVPFPWYELRFSGPIADLIARVKDVTRATDPRLGLYFRQLSMQIDDSLLQEQLLARLASVFGGLALILATVGLYGVVSYSVSRRRSEIGVRMALGSSQGRVVWLILRETAGLLCVAIPLGLAAALVCARFVRSMLFGLTPTDPTTFAGVSFLLLAVAGVAAYLPARRAARIDPLSALRNE